jgi:hypothetical protein
MARIVAGESPTRKKSIP